MRTRRWRSVGVGAMTATVLSATVLAATVLSTPAGAGAQTNALPDNQPPVPAGNPSAVFAKDGPYRAGVAFETTAAGDTVVVTYPVDPATVVGKPTYTVNLLRWFTGSPTAPVPAGLPQNLPTTLSTDAYQSVPISDVGPFPVVMFSHGYGGYPEQSSFLTDHLATWGFVVVAPDHRSRDLKAVLSGTTGQGQDDVTDLRQALDLSRAMNAAPRDLLSGKLDLHRVASLGHSAGGGAAITFAGERDVRAYIGLAPATGTPPPPKPGMIMQGTSDKVVNPGGTVKLFARLPAPKRLILVHGAGHNAFDDACTIGAAQGGLVKFIQTLKLPPAFEAIAVDGCSAPDVAPPTTWPLINQAVTAQLRWALGIDRRPVGLGPGLDTAFRGVTATQKN